MRKINYSYINKNKITSEMRKGQLDFILKNHKENKSNKFYKEKKLTNNKQKIILSENNKQKIIYSKL